MSRQGKHWTVDEVLKAHAMAEAGYDIETMQKELGRSTFSIQKKLAESTLTKVYPQLKWRADNIEVEK